MIRPAENPHETDERMSQIDVATKSGNATARAAASRPASRTFLRAFEWTWTNAVLFSLALIFFMLISTSIMPSFWMYFAEQKIGWAGPTDLEAFLRQPFGTSITDPLSSYGYVMVRDAIAMGLTTLPFVAAPRGVGGDAELAQEAPRRRRRLATDRRVSVGAGMPFTKTEVDIHDDYVVEAVDAAWLAQGVKSPKHLMLDPDNCILCRACEDVCPWNCIWMMSTEIVEERRRGRPSRPRFAVANAIFVVDDNACTRCSVCVDRCPTDTLYYARLPEGSGGRRAMAEVPASQAEPALSERNEERTGTWRR